MPQPALSVALATSANIANKILGSNLLKFLLRCPWDAESDSKALHQLPDVALLLSDAGRTNVLVCSFILKIV